MPGGLGDHRRLPHTGVTRHEDHGPPFSGRRLLVGVVQPCSLGLPGDDSGARHVRQARRERHTSLGRRFIERLPTDIEDLHGLRKAFQFDRAEPLEEVRTAPPAHHPDSVRSQDLTGRSKGTEPSCLYYRVAVVVARLHCRLSAAESYA